MKTCTKCKKEKPITDFPRKYNHGVPGYASHCKVCKNARRLQLMKEKEHLKQGAKEFVFDDHLTNWIVHAVSNVPLQEIESSRNTRGATQTRVLVVWDEVDNDGNDYLPVNQANQQRGSVQISERMV